MLATKPLLFARTLADGLASYGTDTFLSMCFVFTQGKNVFKFIPFFPERTPPNAFIFYFFVLLLPIGEYIKRVIFTNQNNSTVGRTLICNPISNTLTFHRVIEKSQITRSNIFLIPISLRESPLSFPSGLEDDVKSKGIVEIRSSNPCTNI